MLARGTHSERGVMHLGHLPLREVARAGPCLGLVAHDGAHEPEQRTLRREDLHHARAALDFPVGALLHVVGAQALPVRRREVQVRERVGLRLLEHPRRPRAAPLQHLARRVVHGHGGGGVPGAEDRGDDAPHAAPQLPGAGLAHAVAHQVHRAALPGRPLEDLAYGPDQAPVGIGYDELGAGRAAVAQLPQETEPRFVGLRVHHGHPQHPPPAGLVAAYRRDHCGRSHAAPAAALDVGRVEPDVGYRARIERPLREVGYLGVEGRGDRAHAVPAEPLDAHLLGYPLHLPGAGAGGVHLGYRRDERAVDALVALEDVLGEEAARPELGDSQVERAHARLEAAVPVAVPAVGPIAAELVGLLVHDGVDHLLGEQPEQRLDVDHPVGRPRDGGLIRHRVC